MALQPGSLPWLLAHEMRLGWREFRGKRVIILGMAALVLAFAALMALQDDGVRQDLNQFKTAGALPDEALWVTAEILFLLLAVAVVLSFRAGTQALFERGDLDLLLTSPLSSQVVFASRLLGIALNNFLGIGAFLLVPVGLLMGLGLMRLWSVLPATLALTLLGTSLGLLVILLLVQQFGVKLTRTLSSLAIFPVVLLTRLFSQGGDRIAELTAQYPILGPQSGLWLPAQALAGNWLGLLVLWGVAVGAVWLTVQVLHGAFLGGTQESQRSTQRRSPQGERSLAPTHGGHADPRGSGAKASPQFTTNLTRLVLLKEWRLMWRNPDLLSQMVISLVMLVPLFGSTLRPNPQDQLFSHFLLGLVGLMTVTLTVGLANLAIAGEEAPALLQVSPAPPERIQFLKMLAVLMPVWVLAVPLIALLLFRHYPWGWALLLVLGASSCTVFLRRWNAEFGPPTGLKKRRQHSSRDPVLHALELLNYLAWFALGVGLNMSMPVLLYASLATLVGLMAVAYLRNRVLGPALVF